VIAFGVSARPVKSIGQSCEGDKVGRVGTCDPADDHALLQSKTQASTQLAAAIGQEAFAKGFISKGVRRAMTNTSLLLAAAQSAGLAWSYQDASEHVRLLSSELQGALLQVESGQTPQTVPREQMVDEVDDSKNWADDKKTKLKEGAVEGLLSGTELVIGWMMTGQPPKWTDVANVIAEVAIGALSSVNPVLGFVSSVVWGFISSLFGSDDPNPFQELYDKIMEEVKDLITKSEIQTQLGDLQAEMTVISDELEWVPAMLKTSSATTFGSGPSRTLLTYDLILQHDLAKISYKIRNKGITGTADEWYAGVWVLAEQVMILQVNILYDISLFQASHAGPIKKKVEELLSSDKFSWKKFFIDKEPKAKEGLFKKVQAVVPWDDRTVADRGAFCAFTVPDTPSILGKTGEEIRGLAGCKSSARGNAPHSSGRGGGYYCHKNQNVPSDLCQSSKEAGLKDTLVQPYLTTFRYNVKRIFSPSPLRIGAEGLIQGINTRWLLSIKRQQPAVQVSNPSCRIGDTTSLEQFKVIDAGLGKIALYNPSWKKFMRMNLADNTFDTSRVFDDPTTFCKRADCYNWEKFEVVDLGHSQFALYNPHHKRYLQQSYTLFPEREVCSAICTFEFIPCTAR